MVVIEEEEERKGEEGGEGWEDASTFSSSSAFTPFLPSSSKRGSDGIALCCSRSTGAQPHVAL